MRRCGPVGGNSGRPARQRQLEFTIELPVEARPVVRDLADNGILGGVSLGRLYPGANALQNGLVIAVTETVTDEDIAALEAGLKEVCK